MNIFKHEFKAHLRSVISWSVSIFLLLFLVMSIFSSISADAAILNATLDKFPEELLIAFGMDKLDFATVLGFYSLTFLFCQICLAIQASTYGFALVSAEERELTADFLLAKPVSRRQIMTSKLLAAFCGLTITNLVIWITSFATIEIYQGDRGYETGPLLLLLGSIVIFQLFFLSVGMVVSLLMKRVRTVTPPAMALAFGMYVISAFGDMLGEESLEIITPFKHFQPNAIVADGAYDLPLVLISVAVVVISILASYLLYARRDMRAAV